MAIPPTNRRRFTRSHYTWAAVGSLVVSFIGYLLELIRQRGACEHGDPSPDTLVISVYSILIGGGIGGLLVFGFAYRAFRRRHRREDIAPMLVALVAVVMVEPLFLSAGSGPGGWFQYCG